MDTAKLRNNKYFVGNYKKTNKFKGWFVGSFFKDNHPCKTDKIEILYKEHKAGDIQNPHYHKKKVELLIFLEGRAEYRINGKN